MTHSGTHGFRRWVAAFVAVAMLLPTLNGCVTANPPVLRIDGIVVDLERRAPEGEGGWVRVQRGGTTYDAYAGMELQPGDRVETTARAEAIIRYPNGTEVLMRQSSSGRIGSFTDIVGEVFVKVKGIFSADTTFVRAGARGTQYVVRQQAGGTTYIAVFEGSVVVESTRNSWAPVTLNPGDATFAHPRPPEPYRASPEELRRTQDWVERLERKVPVQTTLSPTGVVIGIGIAAAVAAILANSGGGGGGGGGGRPAPQSQPAPTQPPPQGVPPPSRNADGRPTIPASPAPAPTGPAGAVPRGGPSTGTVPGVVPPSPRSGPATTRVPGATPPTGAAPGVASRVPTRTVPAATATVPAKVAPAAAALPRPRDAAARTVIRRPAPAASSSGTILK